MASAKLSVNLAPLTAAVRSLEVLPSEDAKVAFTPLCSVTLLPKVRSRAEKDNASVD